MVSVVEQVFELLFECLGHSHGDQQTALLLNRLYSLFPLMSLQITSVNQPA
jgi:hypothetical protein